jgi:hypothetical protein
MALVVEAYLITGVVKFSQDDPFLQQLEIGFWQNDPERKSGRSIFEPFALLRR